MSDPKILEALRIMDRAIMETHVSEALHDDSPESARRLVGLLADYLSGDDDARSLMPEYMPYFIQAFRAIAGGESADKALHLKVAKGKKKRSIEPGNKRIRNLHIARAVHQLRAKNIQPTRNPTTDTECGCDIVAERYNLSYEAVQKIYYEHLPRIKNERVVTLPV